MATPSGHGRGHSGYQPPTRSYERRAFFDLQRLINELEDRVITLEAGGGGGGPTGSSYVHVQTTPNSVWTIDHNMGFWPNVTVVSSGGDQVEGDVDFTTINQVVITFSGAFAGRAFLS